MGTLKWQFREIWGGGDNVTDRVAMMAKGKFLAKGLNVLMNGEL